MDHRETPSGHLQAAQVPPGLLNIEQAAEYLGYSVRHLQRLVRTGQLPARKAGRTIRFIPAELETWIENLPKTGT